MAGRSALASVPTKAKWLPSPCVAKPNRACASSPFRKRLSAILSHQLGRRLDDVAPAARPEVRHRLHRVEHLGEVLATVQHGDRHRAADVGRVEARMDGVLGRHRPADGDGARLPAARTGIRHHRRADDRRHPQQRVHVAGDLALVRLLLRRLRIEEHRVVDAARAHLRLDWDERLHGREHGVRVRPRRGEAVGLGERGLEPRRRLEAPGDQRLAGDHHTLLRRPGRLHAVPRHSSASGGCAGLTCGSAAATRIW